MKIKITAQTWIMIAAAALIATSAVLMIQASDTTMKLQIDFQNDGSYTITNQLPDETGELKTVQQISATDNTGKTTGSPISISSPTPTPAGSGWSY